MTVRRRNMSNTEGKVVLITGAMGGLGNFVTNAFLDADAIAIGSPPAIAAEDFPHPNFTAMPADLSQSENARRLAGCVVQHFGRIDGLVHLIGGFAGGTS